jgi:hypothetical protein
MARHDLDAVKRVNMLNAAVALGGWDLSRPENKQSPNIAPVALIKQMVHRLRRTRRRGSGL